MNNQADILKNEYIEQCLLAGMLQRSDFLERCLEALVEDDFCFKNNHIIFSAIKKMNDNKEVVNFFSMEDYLQKTEQLDKAGGREYLWSLVENLTPNITNIEPNINILKSCTIRRNISDACFKAGNICFFPGEKNVSQMLEEVEREVFSVIQNNRPRLSNVFSIQGCLSELANELEMQKENDECLQTGFKNVDHLLGPLERGELIIVAGRPSMGKTTFALNIISNFLMSDKKVVFFSLEMPRKQITAKITASLGGFELKSVFRKNFDSNEDWRKYSLAVSKLHKKKFSINDDGCLTVLDIKSCSRNVMNEFKGLDLIVVDYLGLIKPSNFETNKTQQISQISNDLKRLAKELNVPVIAVCQINRGVEARPDKRPNMSDLRDSGEIEQDADKIVFVYRDCIYNSGASEEEAEIIIRKNRNGILGTAKLKFKGEFARFSDFNYEPGGNVYNLQYQQNIKQEERKKYD